MTGSSANCPNEPAAAAMPSTMLRFSGGYARPSTPATTLYVSPESPIPISTPQLSMSASGVVACAIAASPAT